MNTETTTQNRILEVGDTLYRCANHLLERPTGKITIERVTATQAVCGNVRVKREPASYDGSYDEIGKFGYYYLGNDKAEKNYQVYLVEVAKYERRKVLIRTLGHGTDYTKLTDDQLERIYSITKEA